jgi:hypothetical protein
LLRDSAHGIDLLASEPCLNAEQASRSALAFEAMAHRDADRFAVAAEPELSAGASGFTIRHGICPSVEIQFRLCVLQREITAART